MRIIRRLLRRPQLPPEIDKIDEDLHTAEALENIEIEKLHKAKESSTAVVMIVHRLVEDMRKLRRDVEILKAMEQRRQKVGTYDDLQEHLSGDASTIVSEIQQTKETANSLLTHFELMETMLEQTKRSSKVVFGIGAKSTKSVEMPVKLLNFHHAISFYNQMAAFTRKIIEALESMENDLGGFRVQRFSR
tara:strand:+ start:37980 stop:38549 length:570 start_codon:yes stop_codon:yes gene_type:complete